MNDRMRRAFAIVWLVCLAFVPAQAGQGSAFLTDRVGAMTLRRPDAGPSFSFVVLADRTAAGPNSLAVLAEAVSEVNLLGPDLVLNVGDMIPGYGNQGQWLSQMKELRRVTDRLTMPWLPVAGNHDIYWTANKPHPAGEHESDYEKYVGPLWYAMEHKGCWFIVLFSDEGDPQTGKKDFSDPNAQVLSPRQTQWLGSVLGKAARARHIFVFLHQPRWIFSEYGQDWHRVHRMLSRAGVSAVFAGHHHLLSFDGRRDGVQYYRLGTTGGDIDRDLEPDGFHHYLLVTVHPKDFSVAAIKVGSVYDPNDRQFRRWTLVPRQDWRIGEDRKVDFPVETPDLGGLEGVLQIGVTGSIDAWGDKGLEAQVLDTQQRPLLTQFISDKGTVWVQCPVKEKTRYLIRLFDQDTRVEAGVPGHSGLIGARLRVKAACAFMEPVSSIPWPVPRFREYFLSTALFQCSWTPRLASRLPSPSGS